MDLIVVDARAWVHVQPKVMNGPKKTTEKTTARHNITDWWQRINRSESMRMWCRSLGLQKDQYILVSHQWNWWAWLVIHSYALVYVFCIFFPLKYTLFKSNRYPFPFIRAIPFDSLNLESEASIIHKCVLFFFVAWLNAKMRFLPLQNTSQVDL